VLELEENVRRKDLTQYEKSKAMVEYVEAVKEELDLPSSSLPRPVPGLRFPRTSPRPTPPQALAS